MVYQPCELVLLQYGGTVNPNLTRNMPGWGQRGVFSLPCHRLPPAPPGQARMFVVAEQSGELYALLVDQVSEVLSLDASTFERNPPTLEKSWAEFSTGIFRLDGRLLVVLDVSRLLALSGGE